MEEQFIYERSNIKISNQRFVTEDQTYAMSGITSVNIRSGSGGWLVGIPFVGVGSFAALVGIIKPGAIMTPIFLIVGAFMIWLGIYVMKPIHTIILHSASGEAEAISSSNKETIEEIYEALNKAIIQRG